MLAGTERANDRSHAVVVLYISYWIIILVSFDRLRNVGACHRLSVILVPFFKYASQLEFSKIGPLSKNRYRISWGRSSRCTASIASIYTFRSTARKGSFVGE